MAFQIQTLRASGLEDAVAVAMLTARVELRSAATEPLAALGGAGAGGAVESSVQPPPPRDPSPAGTASPASSPPASPSSFPKVPSPSASLAQWPRPAHVAKAGGDAPKLKRSRSSSKVAESKESEEDKAKERELVRQISTLSAEINEAMRSGDRGKVAALMRRRDQLRSASKAPSAFGEAVPGADDVKRARPTTARLPSSSGL